MRERVRSTGAIPPPRCEALRLPPGGRFCIVALGGIGDVMHALPVGNAIKRVDPASRLVWVVQDLTAPLLRPHPAADEVIAFHWRRGWRGISRLRSSMTGSRFDWTLNLDAYFRSVWPTLFSRAPHRVGFGRDKGKDGVWLVANHRLPPRPRGHQQDVILEFLDDLGIPRHPVEWKLTLTDQEREDQAKFFASVAGRPVAAVVVASGRITKDWLPERNASLVDRLQEEFGYGVMLIGGPGARETRLAHAIMELTRLRPIWALGDDVRRLVWLIDGSNLVIAPDTGPLHIAQALDVPVIGLYAATSPARFGPYLRFSDLVVDASVGIAPTGSGRGPPGSSMTRISVQDVLERVRLARRRYPRARGHDPSAGGGGVGETIRS